MKTNSIIYFFCLILLLGSCTRSNPKIKTCPDFPLLAADVLHPDDRAIFNLILNSTSIDPKKRLKQQAGKEVVAESTYSLVSDFNLTADSVEIEDYVRRNQQAIQLPNEFSLPLLPQKEIDCFQNHPKNNSFWENFEAKYPDSNGYVFFNLPGYNADHSQAIMEYSTYYGTVGAHGWLLILEKVNGVWTILERQATWIS